MTYVLWSLAIAVITAVTCSLCGVYLVIKRESLVSEALSHAVLPGIIVAYVILHDRSSPWLIIGAALMGLLMVWLVQLLRQTRLIDSDAALGIVFSALFSIGIVLATMKFRNTHFDAECIIDGNLASAALARLKIGESDWGPKAFVIMSATLTLVLGFIITFYKELKLTMFDPPLATGFGFRPSIMHFVWLGIVSITTVAAFEVAGSVLVVALMIAPPAAAVILTKRVSTMLVVSALIGAACALAGFYVGYKFEISPNGPIASLAGIVFLLVVTLAPGRGLLAKRVGRRKMRKELFQQLLLSRVDRSENSCVAHLDDLFADVVWSKPQFNEALTACRNRNWLEESDQQIRLSNKGRAALTEMSNAIAH